MSSSTSPCAACKCLRRKCMQECVFAPFFPPDNPSKFTNVHKVFGASNVAKLLNELSPDQREDAVNSLAYEAEYRLRDPVYGCVGLISILQQRLKQVQIDLENAKKELATYIGPAAMLPLLNHPHPGLMHQYPNYSPLAYHHHQVVPYDHQNQQIVGLSNNGVTRVGALTIHEPHQQQQQQILEAQQLFGVNEQEMFVNQQQQQQNDFVLYERGFDQEKGGPVSTVGFNDILGTEMEPSLALGGGSGYETLQYHQIEQLQSHSHELLLQQPQSGVTQAQLTSSTMNPPQRITKSEQGSGIDLC